MHLQSNRWSDTQVDAAGSIRQGEWLTGTRTPTSTMPHGTRHGRQLTGGSSVGMLASDHNAHLQGG
jgi:hypothetical protein